MCERARPGVSVLVGVYVASVLAGCGGRTPLFGSGGVAGVTDGGAVIDRAGSPDLGDAGPGPGPDAAPRAAPCRVLERFALLEDQTDVSVSALAVAGDEVAVAWLRDPVASDRGHEVATFSLSDPDHRLGASLLLGRALLLADVSLVPFGGGFAVAWTDDTDAGAELHVGRLEGGQLISDVMLPDAGRYPALGVTPLGRLQVAYVAYELDGSQRLQVAVSDDGLIFPAPVILDQGQSANLALVAVPPASMGLAFTRREGEPSALYFALLDEDGAPTVGPFAITHHDRYVYDVAPAFGAGRIGLGTTDSRENIGSVPLYFTALDPGAAVQLEGQRLTRRGGHETLDMVWDGASFVMAYDEFEGGSGSNATQVFVRPVAPDGSQPFQALQVSEASYREYDCCIRTGQARMAATARGDLVVVWTELGSRPDGSAHGGIRGARLRCLEP